MDPSEECLLCVFQPQYVTVGELHSFIDPNQLTDDLGGSLQYSHRLWLHNRLVRICPFPVRAEALERVQ